MNIMKNLTTPLTFLNHRILIIMLPMLIVGIVPAAAQTNWTQLSATGLMPVRAGHSAVVNSSNGRMIVFGGSPATPVNTALNDVWIFPDVLNNATTGLDAIEPGRHATPSARPCWGGLRS